MEQIQEGKKQVKWYLMEDEGHQIRSSFVNLSASVLQT